MSDGSKTFLIATSDPTFQADVYGRSGVVILDFWASWCAPCRMLMPVLEKLAEENQDWVTLIKVNTDECPIAAGGFGIQGIPAVFALVQDQVVDQFQGALPESAIRQWLQAVKPKWLLAKIEDAYKSAPEKAIEQLRNLIADHAASDELKIKLLDWLIQGNKIQEANQCIEQLESRGFLEPETERLKSRLTLLAMKTSSASADSLRQTLHADPKNHAAKLQLAKYLAGNELYEQACVACLELVRDDRKATGDLARQLMIEIFRVLPDDSEITSKYRRELALALY